MGLGVAVAYLAIALAIFVAPATHADSDIIYQPIGKPYNGKRVYLSAAWHTAQTGARGECPYQGIPRSERQMARDVVKQVATAPQPMPGVYLYGLARMGYKVRFGRGTFTENVARGNAWGANAYVIFHSNAGVGGGCGSTNAAARGTRQIYRTGDRTRLPTLLEDFIDAYTPGTGDKICTLSACTSFNCLAELCENDSPALSYSETEYHDWSKGTAFLVSQRADIGRVMAFAIDAYFGGPRG